MPFLEENVFVKRRGSGAQRVLLTSLSYITKRGRVITAPKGFRTDFASIPTFVRWFVSNEDGRIVRPATIHDFLYTTAKRRLPGHDIPKERVDLIFYESLRECGVSIVKAKIMYYSVCFFGRGNW